VQTTAIADQQAIPVPLSPKVRHSASTVAELKDKGPIDCLAAQMDCPAEMTSHFKVRLLRWIADVEGHHRRSLTPICDSRYSTGCTPAT
jgi:hypothetical protein